MKGTVKFFDGAKGWGFITDENGNDVFIHRTSIIDGSKLKQNDIVEFGIKDGRTDKGAGGKCNTCIKKDHMSRSATCRR